MYSLAKKRCLLAKLKKANPRRMALQRGFLAHLSGFEPKAFRLGVDPIRHREVASNA